MLRILLPCMRGDFGTSTMIVAARLSVEGARHDVYSRPQSPS